MKKSKTVLFFLLSILFASSIISCKIGSESNDKLSNEISSEPSSSESSSETSSESSSESSSEEYETNSESSSEIEGTSITITFDTDVGNEIKEMAVFKDKFVNLPTPTRGNDVFLGWEFENKLYTRIKITKEIKLTAIWAPYGLEFNILEDDTLSVIRYTGNDKNVIVISNGLNKGSGEGIEIVYALRNNDKLASSIAEQITSSGGLVNKYYQLRDPSDTAKDYYTVTAELADNAAIAPNGTKKLTVTVELVKAPLDEVTGAFEVTFNANATK